MTYAAHRLLSVMSSPAHKKRKHQPGSQEEETSARLTGRGNISRAHRKRKHQPGSQDEETSARLTGRGNISPAHRKRKHQPGTQEEETSARLTGRGNISPAAGARPLELKIKRTKTCKRQKNNVLVIFLS